MKCPHKGCKEKEIEIEHWQYCPVHGIIFPKDWNHHYQGWYRNA